MKLFDTEAVLKILKVMLSPNSALLASANADCIIAPVFTDKNDNLVLTGTSWGPIWKRFTSCKGPGGSSGDHGTEDGRNGSWIFFYW